MSIWKTLFKKEADQVTDEIKEAEKTLKKAQIKINALKESYPIDFMLKHIKELVFDIAKINSEVEVHKRFGDIRFAEQKGETLRKSVNDLDILLLDIRQEFEVNKKCLS